MIRKTIGWRVTIQPTRPHIEGARKGDGLVLFPASFETCEAWMQGRKTPLEFIDRDFSLEIWVVLPSATIKRGRQCTRGTLVWSQTAEHSHALWFALVDFGSVQSFMRGEPRLVANSRVLLALPMCSHLLWKWSKFHGVRASFGRKLSCALNPSALLSSTLKMVKVSRESLSFGRKLSCALSFLIW